MNILISEAKKTESATYFRATCENVTALVSVRSYGVNVICENAMHRVWRGGGKNFATGAEALNGYKSGEMKAIIQAALDFANA